MPCFFLRINFRLLSKKSRNAICYEGCGFGAAGSARQSRLCRLTTVCDNRDGRPSLSPSEVPSFEQQPRRNLQDIRTLYAGVRAPASDPGCRIKCLVWCPARSECRLNVRDFIIIIITSFAGCQKLPAGVTWCNG